MPDREITVMLHLATANAFASTLFDRELEKEGLKPAQAGVLFLIERHEPVTPTVLQNEVGVPGATLRARIRSLLESGYVAKTPNREDARSYFLSLTEEGKSYLDVCVRTVARVERMLSLEMGWDIEGLSPRLAELKAAGRKLLLDEDPDALERISPSPPDAEGEIPDNHRI